MTKNFSFSCYYLLSVISKKLGRPVIRGMIHDMDVLK